VSTLLFLRDLPRILPARKKFVPPLQFWIELLAFLSLIAAAAGLFSKSLGGHIAVVIDTSMSMAAIDEYGVTRLETAKTTAQTQISQAPINTRFSLFTAGSSSKRISDIGTTPSLAQSALKELKPSFEQDRLGAIVDGLIASGEYDSVWAFSDHPMLRPESTTPAAPQISIRPVNVVPPSQRVKTTNLWIDEVSARESEGTSYLEVTAQATAPSLTLASITTTCNVSENSIGTSIQPAPVDVELSEGQSKSVTVGPITGPWSFCQVTISPRRPDTRDMLSLDNTAWVTHHSISNELHLVSPLTERELGFSRLKNISVKSISPEEVPALTRPVPAIYHRSLLPAAPQSTILAVLPPAGPLPWGGSISSTESRQVEITRWLASHPLTQYVNIPILAIPSARTIECPETSLPFIFSADGPIACAGERANVRYIILGFEIFPFDGLKTPTLSVLTLNAIKWLFQDISLGNRPNPLGPFIAPLGCASAAQVLPTPKPLSVDPSLLIQVSSPGVVVLRNGTGQEIGVAAFNFASLPESDTRAESPVTFSSVAEARSKPSSATTDLWFYAALFAFSILTLDLLRRLRGKLRWSIR
jgi:hypothetical protein